MIDMDNAQFGGLLVIFIAIAVPVLYSFFVDDYAKDTEDPRDIKH